MSKCDPCEVAAKLIDELQGCPYGGGGACSECQYLVKKAIHEAAGRPFVSFRAYKSGTPEPCVSKPADPA